jgi:hypothetical protein
VRTTEAAGVRELCNVDGGIAERALQIAENNASALARLVQTMHDDTNLSQEQVVAILGLQGYTAHDPDYDDDVPF